MTELQAGIISAVADGWANVRSYASATAPVLGQLRPGAQVQYAPGVVYGGWYSANGQRFNTWYRLDKGFVAAQVVTIVSRETPQTSHYAGGIDVSQAQTALDWHALKAGGVTFALIRATQGVATSAPVGEDTAFSKHIAGALAAGLRVGVYHAYLPDADGKAQADFFHRTVYPYLTRLSFPLALDVERVNGQSNANISGRLADLAHTLEALTGDKPMMYTSPGFWDAHIPASYDRYFAPCPLWVAHWTDAAQPQLPRSWRGKDWLIWQWRVDEDGIAGYGKPLDLDRMRP